MSIQRASACLWGVLVCVAVAAAQTPVGHGVSYQGVLQQGGSAYTGTVDVMGELFDAATGGSAVGTPAEVLGVTVSDGLFSVEFDFGADAFGTRQRWLEVSVRDAGGASYTTLSPRQKVTAAPQSQGPWSVVDGNAVLTEGRAGIGTTTPGAQLHIDGAGSSLLSLWLQNPGNSTGSLEFGSPNGFPGLAAFANNGNRRDFRFGDRGIYLLAGDSSAKPSDFSGLFIGEDGSVGIGTTDPTRRLYVSGDVFALDSIQSGDRMIADEFEYSGGGRLKKVMIPASAFMPRTGGVDYFSGVTAGVLNNTDTVTLVAPLMLPDGSEIFGVEVILRDLSAINDLTVLRVSRIDVTTGNGTALFSGTAAGAVGVTTVPLTKVTSPSNYIVDYDTYAYTITVGDKWDSAGLELHGVRVTYLVASPD